MEKRRDQTHSFAKQYTHAGQQYAQVEEKTNPLIQAIIDEHNTQDPKQISRDTPPDKEVGRKNAVLLDAMEEYIRASIATKIPSHKSTTSVETAEAKLLIAMLQMNIQPDEADTYVKGITSATDEALDASCKGRFLAKITDLYTQR